MNVYQLMYREGENDNNLKTAAVSACVLVVQCIHLFHEDESDHSVRTKTEVIWPEALP